MGEKARESVGTESFEAPLEPCRLLLSGGTMNTSKEAININFDIS